MTRFGLVGGAIIVASLVYLLVLVFTAMTGGETTVPLNKGLIGMVGGSAGLLMLSFGFKKKRE